jgi:transketolase
VITIEEHSRIGGLGSAVSDLLDDHAPRPRCMMKRLGLQDGFARNYGVQDDLLQLNGLSAPQIATAVEDILALAA